MKSSAKKLLIVFCILHIAKCIRSQEQGEEGRAEIVPRALDELEVPNAFETTKPPEADAVTDVPPYNDIGDEGTTEEVRTESSNVDNVPVSPNAEEANCVTNCTGTQSSKCWCDCNSGAILGQIPNDQCQNEEEPNIMEGEIEEDLTTEGNLPVETIDSLANIPSDTTESSTIETFVESTTASTEKPPTPCSAVGNVSHDTDCHSYYSCSLVAAELQLVERSCPQEEAFNVELGRCTRDISACNDEDPTCELAGTSADPQSNSSYYWCIARLTGDGFHKYLVKCDVGEVFVPQLGKCFIDINNLENLPPNYGLDDDTQLDDKDIVKAELKQFKVEEKARLKAQKQKDKLEQKLQKELAKKAMKEAKEQEKLKGSSKEEENFVCTQEGNFASTASSARYYSCISKKGKFKAVSMKCPIGHGFDQQQAACISITAA